VGRAANPLEVAAPWSPSRRRRGKSLGMGARLRRPEASDKRWTCGISRRPRRAKLWTSEVIRLEGQIGPPPSFGESPPYGERIPPSFRLSSIKVGARTAAKPAPERGLPWHREWLGRNRLEQAKGFQPSTPTSARVSVGRGKLRSVLGDDVAPMPATVPLPLRHARPDRAGIGATGSVPSVPAFRRHPPPPPSGSAPSIAFAAGTARTARNAGCPADRGWQLRRCRGRARAPPRPG
jgi:hypothetical protein